MKDRLLFSVCPDSEFFGRTREIDYILRKTEAHKASPNIFLTGRRWMGKTEVLRRVHRDLFWSQAKVAPVYYQFKGYGSADIFAEDYLKEVIKQYIAFRERSNGITRVEVSLEGLERLLMDNDPFGLSGFIGRHREARRSGDHIAALRNAVTAPHLITISSGIPVYLILDDLDQARAINVNREGRFGVIKEFMEALNSGSFSFLASSPTKQVLEGGVLSGSIEALELSGLDSDLAVSMMMDLCRQYNVEFDTEILTLASGKLEGSPMYIKNIVWAAHRAEKGFVSLKDFADLYAGEVIEGNIGFALRSSFHLKGLNDLRVLNACANSRSPASEEELAERFKLGHGELRNTIEELSASGLIEANLGSIRWAGDRLVTDFVHFIYSTRIKGSSVEEAKTCIIRAVLKEGFDFKGSKVRGRLKEEAAGVLRAFNGQRVLKLLFRNQLFAARYKNGVIRTEEANREDDELILPQTAGCFDTSRWEANETGPPILIAHGFQNGKYDSGNEVVWAVGIKEAMSPVNLGDVENFIRRCQILRENFGTVRVIRWLISREGFTGEAQKRMEAEGVYSTDSVQMRILKESIEDRASRGAKPASRIAPHKEFEVVLPTSTKSELVAVKAVEEIGTEMGFDDNAIGQIKAALVEACINAFEHGGSRSAKIFLRFVAGSDRLVIHVRNAGADFSGPPTPAAGGEGRLPQKRGWGIELMKGLMDEVRFEKVGGGTNIVMVKYLIKKGDNKDEQA